MENILEPGYTINDVLYWTDSMEGIRYITIQSSRYQVFVANRLAVIHNGSQVLEWRYINDASNPADHASRGIAPEQKKTEWREISHNGFRWIKILDHCHWNLVIQNGKDVSNQTR